MAALKSHKHYSLSNITSVFVFIIASFLAFNANALSFFKDTQKKTVPVASKTDETVFQKYIRQAGLKSMVFFEEADRKFLIPKPKASTLTHFPVSRPNGGRNMSLGNLGKNDLECLAEAVYFEARGEGRRGGIAVGEVILNRARHHKFPSSVCGVIFQRYKNVCQFSFACDQNRSIKTASASWLRSRQIAEELLNQKVSENITGDALFFHARRVNPRWASKMRRTVSIGRHLFYKPLR